MPDAIGVQLFTVREQLEADYAGTLKRIAEIGYHGIELGPFDLATIVEHREWVRRLDLKTIGCHALLEQLTIGVDGLVRSLHEMGGEYVALSSRFQTMEEIKRAALLFNQIGKQLKEQGIRFLYHHHDWELAQIEGKAMLDWLIEWTDSEWVGFELDTYWLARGGADPVTYIGRLQNRCPVLHIKDMEAGKEAFFSEIGEGVLDFNAIFAAAEASGVQWMTVEQDACRRNPLDSLALSYFNLTRMGLAPAAR